MTLGEWCKQIPPPVASYSSRKLAAECTECYSDESMMGPKGATPERCRCIPLDSLQGFPTRIHSNSCFRWDRWDHFPYTIHTVYFSLTCFFHSCFIIIITDLLIHFAGVFFTIANFYKRVQADIGFSSSICTSCCLLWYVRIPGYWTTQFFRQCSRTM